MSYPAEENLLMGERWCLKETRTLTHSTSSVMTSPVGGSFLLQTRAAGTQHCSV